MDDEVMAGYQSVRGLVGIVQALSADLPVRYGDSGASLAPSVGSALATACCAKSADRQQHGHVWGFNMLSVASGQERGDADLPA